MTISFPMPTNGRFLSSIRQDRPVCQLERIVREAEAAGSSRRRSASTGGQKMNRRLGPCRRRAVARNLRYRDRCRASLELIINDEIYIAKDVLPPALRNRLLRLAAFQNPEFYKAQAMRLPTYDKPRIIACAEDHPLTSACRVAAWTTCKNSYRSLKIKQTIRDERYSGRPLGVSSTENCVQIN